MELTILLGFIFLLLAGFCNGLYATPSKYVKVYKWENLWGAAFFLTMVVIPLTVIPLMLKSPYDTVVYVWDKISIAAVLAPLFFGFLWGIGFILFTIVLEKIGFSITYAIVFGIIALFGALVPMIVFNNESIFTTGGIVIVLGISLCTLGVAIVGYAGVLKQKKDSGGKISTEENKNLWRTLLICIVTGFFCACPNFGFTFGKPLIETSEKIFGNIPAIASLSNWMLMFAGGFLATGTYTGYVLTKKKTWTVFKKSGSGFDFFMALAIAVIHFGIFTFYGMGAHLLGELGASVGWALQFSVALIVANLFGFMTKEWKNSSSIAIKWIIGGLTMLVISSVVLGFGNSLLN